MDSTRRARSVTVMRGIEHYGHRTQSVLKPVLPGIQERFDEQH